MFSQKTNTHLKFCLVTDPNLQSCEFLLVRCLNVDSQSPNDKWWWSQFQTDKMSQARQVLSILNKVSICHMLHSQTNLLILTISGHKEYMRNVVWGVIESHLNGEQCLTLLLDMWLTFSQLSATILTWGISI